MSKRKGRSYKRRERQRLREALERLQVNEVMMRLDRQQYIFNVDLSSIEVRIMKQLLPQQPFKSWWITSYETPRH